MKPTQVLMEEHEVILRVLSALESTATRLKNGRGVRAGFFLDSAGFIKGFADGYHHRKEEGVLFPAMIASGLPAESGPIAVMLAEHEQGREYNRNMRQAAERLSAGEVQAASSVVENALGYVLLLRQHIYKENNILFPMADRVIPPLRQGQVEADFEKVEREETGASVHEKYEALAQMLEEEAKSD